MLTNKYKNKIELNKLDIYYAFIYIIKIKKRGLEAVRNCYTI